MKAIECNAIFKKVIEDYHVNDHVDSEIVNPFEKKKKSRSHLAWRSRFHFCICGR